MLHYTYSSKRARFVELMTHLNDKKNMHVHNVFVDQCFSYIVGTIYCLGLIYSLPRFFEYRTDLKRESYDVSSPFENNTMHVEYYLVIHRLGESRIYQYCVHLSTSFFIFLLFRWWQMSFRCLVLYSFFQSILPLLMLSYFNVELIRSIHASSNFLKRCATNYGQKLHMNNETNSRRVRETIVTRSVICLIGLFIICQVPASILNYIYMYHRTHPLLYICYDISNFLILFNSAVSNKDQPHRASGTTFLVFCSWQTRMTQITLRSKLRRVNPISILSSNFNWILLENAIVESSCFFFLLLGQFLYFCFLQSKISSTIGIDLFSDTSSSLWKLSIIEQNQFSHTFPSGKRIRCKHFPFVSVFFSSIIIVSFLELSFGFSRAKWKNSSCWWDSKQIWLSDSMHLSTRNVRLAVNDKSSRDTKTKIQKTFVTKE